MEEKVTISVIWNEYRIFCKQAIGTQDFKSDSAPDFLAWLENRLIGK